MLEKNQPIVVKKIKKGGHAHHGGAWKIAYADFVTAMMAFFLLMWLLAMTTPEQKRAISEYFQNPTSTVGGQQGASSSLISVGSTIAFETASLGQNPNPTYQGPRSEYTVPNDNDAKKRVEELEQKSLENLKEQIEQAIDQNQRLMPFKDQLKLDMTKDGLVIQVMDKNNRPMFALGSAEVQPYMIGILHELAKFINDVPNNISLAGHTDALNYNSSAGYTNWELSSDRANASRRELIAGGMNPEKISRVQGLASTSLHDTQDPNNPINRRISITVLKQSALDDIRAEGAVAPALTPSDAPAAPAETATPVQPPTATAQATVTPAPAALEPAPVPTGDTVPSLINLPALPEAMPNKADEVPTVRSRH